MCLWVVILVVTTLGIPTVAHADYGITVVLDGEILAFDVQPTIINDRTMVPIRTIFEALGATVEWDDSQKMATAEKDGTKVVLYLGSEYFFVDGETRPLYGASVNIDGRILVPLRGVSEAFYCDVGWDGLERVVSIISTEGWLDYSMLYAPGGRSKAFKNSEVCAQFQSGWYLWSDLSWNTPHGDYDSNFYCKLCGEYCEPKMEMTLEQQQNAEKVEWISERQVWYDSNNECFVLVFSLLDGKKNEIAAPSAVAVTIYNDNNELVYDSGHYIDDYDFLEWSYNNGAVKKYQATIRIYDYMIDGGTTDSGTIYFDVFNPGYFDFDLSTLSIYGNLPYKETTVVLPHTPQLIHDFNWNDKIDSSCNVTEIRYEISEYGDMYLYFSGEKTYDIEGNGYSKSCKVGWKLYDSEGYVKKSGTIYSPAIKVGEKFRNVKEYIYDIEIGETYTLVIENVD